MYQAIFNIVVGEHTTIEGLNWAIQEITGVGYVTNLDSFSFDRRVLEVAIDGDSLWDLAVTYETLRGTLHSIETAAFDLPDRPEVFHAGSRVEAGVPR